MSRSKAWRAVGRRIPVYDLVGTLLRLPDGGLDPPFGHGSHCLGTPTREPDDVSSRGGEPSTLDEVLKVPLVDAHQRSENWSDRRRRRCAINVRVTSDIEQVCSMSKITNSGPACAARCDMPLVLNSNAIVPTESRPCSRLRFTTLHSTVCFTIPKVDLTPTFMVFVCQNERPTERRRHVARSRDRGRSRHWRAATRQRTRRSRARTSEMRRTTQ
jgi:hypothetical protein